MPPKHYHDLDLGLPWNNGLICCNTFEVSQGQGHWSTIQFGGLHIPTNFGDGRAVVDCIII